MTKKGAIGWLVLAAVVLAAGVSWSGIRVPEETEVLLTGGLNQNHQFVDEEGRTYDLAINERTVELLDMPRQVIRIKGTLKELDDRKTLTIEEILPAGP